jgi:hypothetical protein
MAEDLYAPAARRRRHPDRSESERQAIDKAHSQERAVSARAAADAPWADRRCLVVVCHNGPVVFTETVQSLIELGWGDRVARAKAAHGFSEISFYWARNFPRVDAMRDSALDLAQREGFTHVLFLDADMVWPTDVLERMLRTPRDRKAIVCGLYVCARRRTRRSRWARQVPPRTAPRSTSSTSQRARRRPDRGRRRRDGLLPGAAGGPRRDRAAAVVRIQERRHGWPRSPRTCRSASRRRPPASSVSWIRR